MSRNELATVVAHRTAQLTALSRHLIRIAEEEKRHLAAELHDELGSLHSVLGMELESVLKELRERAPDLVERQTNALKLLQQARDVKRRIVADLHPAMLDHLGLPATLKEYVERWSRTSGVTAKLQLADNLPPLPKDAALALFRIAQESLTNVSMYAQAKNVSIALAPSRTSSCWRSSTTASESIRIRSSIRARTAFSACGSASRNATGDCSAIISIERP